MRRGLVVAFCVLTVVLASARQQQPQQPTFRTGVDIVAVDVHVVDGAGRPVPDLKADDFTVTVDGKARTLVASEYVSHGVNTSATPAAQPTPRPAFSSNWMTLPTPGRTILIVVDHENIAAGYGRAAIQAIERFLDRMQPNDRVGLMLLTRSNVSIDPTTDRQSIRKALPNIIGHQGRADAGSPYTLGQVEAFSFEHDKKAWGDALARECFAKYSSDDPRLPACLKEMETYAREIITDSRRRQVDSMRSLVALFNALAQVPGPKSVVLVSQQLPVAPYLAETSDFNAEARPLAQAASRARVNVYVLHLDTPQIDLEKSNVPASSLRADADMGSFGLETVTTATGGRRMMVSGKPEAAFDRIALEISGHYELGFRSEAADRDGKPHEIKVAVKRKGVDLRARQFFSYAAEASVDKNATDAVNRLLRAATSEPGIPMSVATYSLMETASDASRMRILITAEIDRGAAKESPLTVGYTLTDSAGRNAGANVEQVSLKPAADHPDRPLVYTAAALVPPGSYTLRIAAADTALRAGSVAHQFEARPIEAGATTLSDLVVLDSYVAEAGKPRPSVSGTAAGQLRCYFEAYAAAQALGKVTAQLELADAVDAAPRVSAPFDVEPADATGRMRLSGGVPLADVPPGDYVARAVFLANGNPVGRVTRPVHVTRIATPTAAVPAAAVPAAAAVQPPPAQPPAAAPPSQARAPEPAARPAKQTAPAANVGELMARVAAYIDDYSQQMSLVIGIEHYGQWMQREDYGSSEQMRMGGAAASVGASRAISRQLVAEFALVRVGNDWDGFRNVYEVDGKPVPDAKDRMARLFTQAPATAIEQSRKIAAESSRYNMGAMQRNFNVPTVALFFLSAANQGRFKFTKDKDDEVGGVKVWKVKFEESQKPTIIRTSTGKDMPVKGEAWIDPIDGRVMKTHMQIDSEMGASSASKGSIGEKIKTTASITATYAFEPKLGILVPSEMLETYEAPMRSQFTGDDNMTKVNCRATYSDFKRFETSGRLVAPK